ncbi:MAG TPA: DUF4157 domain-containing protein [Micromonosporaceae bacterium]|nr:DUF4157 domain-containing protein [Micromonosporaceae bacterium]
MTRVATRVTTPRPVRAPAAPPVATPVTAPQPAAAPVVASPPVAAPSAAAPARLLADAERQAELAAESVVNGENAPSARLSRLPAAPAGHPGGPPPPAPPGGYPLPPDERASMQRRLGHDFGSVRVHSGSDAGAAARALHAHAFTVGEHVVLGAGVPGLHTPAGRRVLAHELVHVVQQRGGPACVQRLGFWESVGVFLGTTEGDFSKRELLDYLAKVTASHAIEGSYDSDNKARAVVRRYKSGDTDFDLTAPQKTVLIEEMLDGPTLAADELLIVTLLELSDDPDLQEIVFFGGITPERLEADITGEEPRRRLDLLLANRFPGGRAAVVAGDIEPDKMPRDDYVPDLLVLDLAAARPVGEIVAELTRLPPVVRERATRFLGGHRVQLHRQAADAEDAVAAEPDPTKRSELEAARDAILAERLRVDIVLHHMYRDVAGGETVETLLETTAVPFPVEQATSTEGLKPEPAPSTVDATTGKPKEFKDLPAKVQQQYEVDLRAKLADVIDASWDEHAKDKGPQEHADPAKTYQISEMERIAARAKVETDAVFGHLGQGPALLGDQPGKRGNIHDRFVAQQEKIEAMSPAQRREYAKEKVSYFLVNNAQLLKVHRAVGAVTRYKGGKPDNAETVIQAKLIDEATDTDAEVTKLNEIQRGWGGSASEGHIYTQLFKEKEVADQQVWLWRKFHTMVHEYLHNLTHSRYWAYANTFEYGTPQYTTLIEGVVCVLTETVWAMVAPRARTDEKLMVAVQGAELVKLKTDPEEQQKTKPDPADPPHPYRYPGYAEAVKLYTTVGAANVYAAFFLGDVKKIGAP